MQVKSELEMHPNHSMNELSHAWLAGLLAVWFDDGLDGWRVSITFTIKKLCPLVSFTYQNFVFADVKLSSLVLFLKMQLKGFQQD